MYKETITEFWNQHYHLDSQDHGIYAYEVFDFFKSLNETWCLRLQHFNEKSQQHVPNLKMHTANQDIKMYKVKSKTTKAIHFHQNYY